MDKNVKYGLIIIIIILALIISLVYFKSNNPSVATSPEQIAGQEQAKTIADTQARQAALAAQNAASPAPVLIATKTIKIEFMSDAEKTQLSINPNSKIQILARDEKGTISAYKVINSDSDIVTKFGN